MSTATVVPVSAAKERAILAWVIYTAGCIILLSLLMWRFPPDGVFGTYWASGNAANHHLNPYAAYPETFRFDFSRFGGPDSLPDLNLNPPCVLPMFQLVALLPIHEYGVVWTVANLMFFVISAGLLIRLHPAIQFRQILWIPVMRPVFETFSCGQIYLLLFCLAVIAWALYERGKEDLSAITIGLFVAIKPTMMFWPVLLLLVPKHRRMGRYSLATVGVAYILPVLFYGPRIYVQWLNAIKGDQHWRDVANIGLIPLFRRFGLPGFGYFFAASLAVAIAIWAIQKQPDFVTLSGASICAGILCSPLAWFVYFLWVVPFFVARRWNWLGIGAAAAFTPHPALPFTVESWLVAVAATLLSFMVTNSRTAAESS